MWHHSPLTFLLTLALVASGCQSESAPSSPNAGPKPAPSAAHQPQPQPQSGSETNTTPAHSPSGKPRSRTFELDYGIVLNGVPRGAHVRAWFPVPPTTSDQVVGLAGTKVPIAPRETTEAKYGNKILHFDLKCPNDEPLSFEVTWLVTRKEVRGLEQGDPVATLDEEQRQVFLAANTKVPIDGKPLTLIEDFTLPDDQPLKVGKALFERVDAHMRYDKSRPGFGRGDVLWACASGFGNCTDFHSLFISLSRSQKIPAKFEIGFPLPPERGEGSIEGYHCWAQFFVDSHGWVPTDISEADKHPQLKPYYFGNLTENRVLFTTGRDITLVPRQSGEPLNYFVYPHVEVDGETWPVTKTQRRFGFRDRQGTEAAASTRPAVSTAG